MAGDDDSIFSNLPRRFSYTPTDPWRGYRDMPYARRPVDDRRGQPMQPDPDMTVEQFVQSNDGDQGLGPDSVQNPYPPSPMSGAPAAPQVDWNSPDPSRNYGDLARAHMSTYPAGAYGANPYYPSGPHPAPQQPLNFPPGIAPGTPGWTTPPSPSGPHPAAAYPAGQGPQPPIFSPEGWSQPPAGPMSVSAMPYYLQNAGYGQ